MLNPHPPLAAFPAVLLTLTLGAEAASYVILRDELRRFAKSTLWTLVLFAPLTYISGYWGVDHANGSYKVPEQAIVQHQASAKLFLLTLVPLCIVALLQNLVVEGDGAEKKLRVIRGFYLALLLLCGACGFTTSYLGGSLVFSHGAGVLVGAPEE